MPKTIFVSSVQSEFAEERAAIRDFVNGDPLLGRHFRMFLFEDQPAQARGPVDLYLDEVDACDVYLALLAQRYGFEDAEGVSATEREFERAVVRRKHRLGFIKTETEDGRHEKEKQFVAKIERQVIRRTFTAVADLTGLVYASLIRVLEEEKVVESQPFDVHPADATFKAIDTDKVRAFQARAAEARHSAVQRIPAIKDLLTHLNLTDGKHPFNAAVLLFGRHPKTTIPTAETKCLHYAGPQASRPALSHQVFDGPLPDQIDSAVEFVMSRLARSVGVREAGPRLPCATRSLRRRSAKPSSTRSPTATIRQALRSR